MNGVQPDQTPRAGALPHPGHNPITRKEGPGKLQHPNHQNPVSHPTHLLPLQPRRVAVRPEPPRLGRRRLELQALHRLADLVLKLWYGVRLRCVVWSWLWWVCGASLVQEWTDGWPTRHPPPRGFLPGPPPSRPTAAPHISDHMCGSRGVAGRGGGRNIAFSYSTQTTPHPKIPTSKHAIRVCYDAITLSTTCLAAVTCVCSSSASSSSSIACFRLALDAGRAL